MSIITNPYNPYFVVLIVFISVMSFLVSSCCILCVCMDVYYRRQISLFHPRIYPTPDIPTKIKDLTGKVASLLVINPEDDKVYLAVERILSIEQIRSVERERIRSIEQEQNLPV